MSHFRCLLLPESSLVQPLMMQAQISSLLFLETCDLSASCFSRRLRAPSVSLMSLERALSFQVRTQEKGADPFVNEQADTTFFICADGVGLLGSVIHKMSCQPHPPKVLVCTHFSELLSHNILPPVRSSCKYHLNQ